MSTLSPPSKRERRKEERPGELLDAALTIFVDKGYAATRVEEVAALAGVSKGTLFLYFPSKEELFKAVVRKNIAGRFQEWRDTLDQFQGDSAELIGLTLHTWWTCIGMTPASGITKLMLSEVGNFPDLAAFYQKEVIEPGRDILRRVLQRGIDRGELRPLDLDNAVYSLLAPMNFLVTWKHAIAPSTPPSQAIDPIAFINCHVDLILNGMRQTSAAGQRTAPPSPPR